MREGNKVTWLGYWWSIIYWVRPAVVDTTFPILCFTLYPLLWEYQNTGPVSLSSTILVFFGKQKIL